MCSTNIDDLLQKIESNPIGSKSLFLEAIDALKQTDGSEGMLFLHFLHLSY